MQSEIVYYRGELTPYGDRAWQVCHLATLWPGDRFLECRTAPGALFPTVTEFAVLRTRSEGVANKAVTEVDCVSIFGEATLRETRAI